MTWITLAQLEHKLKTHCLVGVKSLSEGKSSHLPTVGVLGGAHGIPATIPECVSDKKIFFTLSSSEFSNFRGDDVRGEISAFSSSSSCFLGEDVQLPVLSLVKLALETCGKRMAFFVLLSFFFGA